MAAFNLFNKTKIDWVTLPNPDDSIEFFETIKKESEKFWADSLPNRGISGFQIQADTHWKPGLGTMQIEEFEQALGLPFPIPLRNFYTMMNGLTKPGINLYGSSGTPPTFRPVFYSYPDDVSLMKEQIDWIYEATSVRKEALKELSISRLVPI